MGGPLAGWMGGWVGGWVGGPSDGSMGQWSVRWMRMVDEYVMEG